MTRPPQPIHYLTRPQIAALLGVARQTVDRYHLPPPDSTHGAAKEPGWLPATIDRWDAGRPSRQGKASK